MQTKVIKKYSLWLKLVLLIGSLFFIWLQLRGKDEGLLLCISSFSFKESFYWKLALIVFLAAVNIGIEAFKWQYLVRKIQEIDYFKAYWSVMSGMAVGFFTPNKTGEFLGKIFALDTHKRWQGAYASVVGSISQLLVTLIFGVVGSILFFKIFFVSSSYTLFYILLFVAILLIFACSLVYFRNQTIVSFLKKKKIPLLQGIILKIAIDKPYSIKQLVIAFFLSMLRYLVFSLQYYLAFKLMGIEIFLHYSLIITATWFLMITVIPSFAFAELGVKGAASLFLFGLYSAFLFGNSIDYTIPVLSATILIWIINTVIPSIVGAFFIFKFKID